MSFRKLRGPRWSIGRVVQEGFARKVPSIDFSAQPRRSLRLCG